MEFLFYLAVGVAGYLMGRNERVDRAVEKAFSDRSIRLELNNRILMMRATIDSAFADHKRFREELNASAIKLGRARAKNRRMHVELRRLSPPKLK